MKWKARQREIARLRKKHRVVAPNALPDLTVDRSSSRYPSITPKSSGESSHLCTKRSRAEPVVLTDAVVGTPHKQGPMVMFRSELPWAGGKKS